MAVVPTRDMGCRNCGHAWPTAEALPDTPVDCPNCGHHVCACGCGTDMSDMRSNAVWKERAHYMRLHRDVQAGRRPRNQHGTSTGHQLDDVRGEAEENPEKARWTLIVREQIARTLVATGYFSAEDLDPLGVPETHVNVSTSQIGSFAARKYMKKLNWRRSEKPSRKGGIVWTFQITEKGRDELPKMLAGTGATEAQQGEGSAGTEVGVHGSSTAPSTGPGGCHAANPSGAPTSAGADPGDESDQLFPVPDEVGPSTSPYSAEAA